MHAPGKARALSVRFSFLCPLFSVLFCLLLLEDALCLLSCCVLPCCALLCSAPSRSAGHYLILCHTALWHALIALLARPVADADADTDALLLSAPGAVSGQTLPTPLMTRLKSYGSVTPCLQLSTAFIFLISIAAEPSTAIIHTASCVSMLGHTLELRARDIARDRKCVRSVRSRWVESEVHLHGCRR